MDNEPSNPDELRTADDLQTEACQKNPGVRFAWNGDKRTVFGYWEKEADRWVPFAAMGLDGQWYGKGIGNIRANGKPLVADDEWLEVQYPVRSVKIGG